MKVVNKRLKRRTIPAFFCLLDPSTLAHELATWPVCGMRSKKRVGNDGGASKERECAQVCVCGGGGGGETTSQDKQEDNKYFRLESKF